MSSEIRRGIARILSNYMRLLATFAIGLILTPLLVDALKEDAFGMIGLLGSAVGLTAMLRDVVQRSMVRELAAAWHSGDPLEFHRTFCAGYVLSAAAAFLTAILFALLWLVIPYFKMPPQLVPGVQIFVLANAGMVFFVIALSPHFNMYLITERMIAYNVWRVVERLCYLLPAIWLAFVARPQSPATGLAWYGIGASILGALQMITAAALIRSMGAPLWPSLQGVQRRHYRSFLEIGGWNTGVVVAMNGHARVDMLIMNIFGPIGNLMFGLGLQVTSYMRMLTTGITTGLDAVAARLSAQQDHGALKRLMHHATRLHGLMTFPAVAFLMLISDPFLRLWVGPTLEDPQTTIPRVVMLIQVLILGVAIFAISDCWIFILYGAGHIRRYAPLIMAGGVMNPILAGLLIWLLPPSLEYTGPAIALSTIFFLVHFIAVPAVGAPALGLRLRDLYMPLLPPLLCAVLAAPILLAGRWWITQWSWTHFLLVSLVYGAVYFLLSSLLVLMPSERHRVWVALMRRIGMHRPATVEPPPGG
jgi:O-antigen/teichoic acid export membrane protein